MNSRAVASKGQPHLDPQPALLQALGGEAGCKRLSAEFYARVGRDPEDDRKWVLGAGDYELKKDRLHFRNEIVSGPGGSEIPLDDPSGNPVELFQAGR